MSFAYAWRSGLVHFRERGVPDLYANEEGNDPLVRVKLFDPCGRWTYYVLEAGVSGSNGRVTLFGYCVSPLGADCDELGYQDLDEAAQVKNALGLHMEEDLHWTPKKLSEVMK